MAMPAREGAEAPTSARMAGARDVFGAGTGREVLEWPYTTGGGGVPHPPPDQRDHRGKKPNLPSGNWIGPFLVHKPLGPPPAGAVGPHPPTHQRSRWSGVQAGRPKEKAREIAAKDHRTGGRSNALHNWKPTPGAPGSGMGAAFGGNWGGHRSTNGVTGTSTLGRIPYNKKLHQQRLLGSGGGGGVQW